MTTQENIPYTADEIKAMVKTSEKYNQALERARDLMTKQNPPAFNKDLISLIFPELASEDDRIRKGIIRNLQYLMDRSEGFVKKDLQERIAWLEKQGEQHSSIDTNKMVDEFAHTEVKGYGIPSVIEVDAYRKGIEDTLEKQSEQSTDKIEPKFKVSQKMKEAGYELDAEKKELKKIMQNPAWGEKDDNKVKEIIEYLNEFYNNYRLDLQELNDYETWLKSIKQRLESEKKPTDDAKKLDPNKMFEWLCNNSTMFGARWCKTENIIEQFRRDFDL